MASEATTEPETTTTATTTTVTEDMEVENPQPVPEKREREDEEEQNGVVSKKQKVDEEGEEEKSVEESRMEKLEEEAEDKEKTEEKEEVKKVDLGPKTFESSVQMFDYFYKFLHHWPTNVKVNKYEQMVLVELIKKGHPDPEKKIGSGVRAFEIRQHPEWKSRCFFVIREDESFEDFSFRKCVDHILPLPENMKIKSDVNKALGGGGKKGSGGGGGGGGGGRGGGRGRGRGRGGGKFRR